MEQRLQAFLQDGEVVRWVGRPAPFKLIQLPFRNSYFMTWLLSGILILWAALYLHQGEAAGAFSLAERLVIMAAISFLPALISLRPVLDKLCLERSTLYAITNRRVVALVRGEFMCLPLSASLPVQVEEEEEDCGNLCFADAIGCSARESRSNAVLGIRRQEGGGTMNGILFYHIHQPKTLLRYLA